MSTFLKDTLRLGLSKVIIIFCGLGSSIITARYLGPEKNGIIAALILYPGLFITVGSLGIRQSATYFLGKKIYSEKEIKTAITQIWLFTTLISLMICFVLMRNFSNSGDNLYWVLLALAPLPFSLFNTYNSGIFLGKNDIKTFNKINWIPSLLSFTGVVIFVLSLKMDVSGAMMASIFGPFIMSFILLFKNKFIQSFNFRYNWTIIKSMLSLGIVYALSLLIINLNTRVDIIILDKLSSPTEMGIYAKGVSLVEKMWQIPMIIGIIIFSRSSVSKRDNEFSYKVTQLLRICFFIISILAILIYIIAPSLILTLFGNKFFGSILVLRLLLPGVVIYTIFIVMNMDLAGKGKPWVSMKAMVPALIVNIVLNLLVIPEHGANGASLASTISYTIAGILFLHFYSKEVKISIKEILKYKKTDFDPILLIIKRK